MYFFWFVFDLDSENEFEYDTDNVDTPVIASTTSMVNSKVIKTASTTTSKIVGKRVAGGVYIKDCTDNDEDDDDDDIQEESETKGDEKKKVSNPRKSMFLDESGWTCRFSGWEIQVY